MRKRCAATAALLGAAMLLSRGALAEGGWVANAPPGAAVLDCGRRNSVFTVGEPVVYHVKGKEAPTRYDVRNFDGDLVASGAASETINLPPQGPGWYKLTVYGATEDPKLGSAIAGTTYCVFRKDPRFPPVPDRSVSGGAYPSFDEPMRGVLGMGPQRLFVQDASKPDEAIERLRGDIALDRKYYLPYDPVRKRVLMIAFPNGTKDLEGVRKIVSAFKDEVRYWEPRNEPNGGSSGADFALKEMKPFYERVKSVDPKLKVMGPGTVSIGPVGGGLSWIEDFLKAGGGKFIDVFSFHAYNTLNGDLPMARLGMDSLHALLVKYRLGDIEKWQTEQGYFAAMYGAYLPGHQGRWTMLEMMVYEQYGIPKEHNHLWYDRSHGFWDFPTWWENEDGSLNPAGPLMRVWAEELYGKRFTRAYDLGTPGNRLALGSLFSGGGRQTAAFMSAGSVDHKIRLRVTGTEELRTISAFGVPSALPVRGGYATLNAPNLPVYVELSPGMTITPEPTSWGPDLALQEGVEITSSGTGAHPVDKNIPNDIRKIANGVLENWYWTQQPKDQAWMDDTPTFPAWVHIELPKEQPVSRVVIYSGNPWQWMGSLLDYELQVEKGGGWVTIEHVKESPRTFKVYTPITRTSVDSYARDRWVFEHHFPTVTTRRVRLVVHDVTWGGGATEDVVHAGGQTGPHHLMLREVEIYGK